MWLQRVCNSAVIKSAVIKRENGPKAVTLRVKGSEALGGRNRPC